MAAFPSLSSENQGHMMILNFIMNVFPALMLITKLKKPPDEGDISTNKVITPQHISAPRHMHVLVVVPVCSQALKLIVLNVKPMIGNANTYRTERSLHYSQGSHVSTCQGCPAHSRDTETKSHNLQGAMVG